MAFKIESDNFIFNGKKIFLNSGEIHYFRIRRALWETHLRSAVEAGLKTVSTYVPWDWHEPEEGVFDFDGNSLPERDLRGWLTLCQKHGLTCIVKPGPFILAEFRGAGLPNWLIERLGPEGKMHNRRGEPVAGDGVRLFNPVYLDAVERWYQQVLPVIGKFEITHGGPIIMMQVCNEIGVFSWLAHQADYGHPVKERFIAYIKSHFESIEDINYLWQRSYINFESIELPADGRLAYESQGDRARDYHWHCFWRAYYGDYLKMLAQMARSLGITVPLYHNLPGWIYGNGYEFPVNITMYEELYGDKSDIIFGVDHIPEFVSYRNMHDDRIINDITRAMQGDKPLFAAEFQCGSREYHVVTNNRELELFYKASIANGLKGWNYYMFSQGNNPPRKGYSGDTFYWFTPLAADGSKNPAFDLVKNTNRLISVLEPVIVEANRQAEVCVLFYPPYYATELERPETGGSSLKFVPSAIRRPAYFDGLLKVLQVLNIDYDMADLSKVDVDDLKHYKQLWAFATDEMNPRDQEVIVDYAKQGGQVVIYPYLPDRDMAQGTCTIIRDALGVYPSGSRSIDSPLIDVLDFKDIKCANPQITYSETSLPDCTVIARTIDGASCGFEKNLGRGQIIHLGAWMGFDTEGHKPVYEALLKKSNARLSRAWTDNEWLTVRLRSTDNGAALLFAGNYYNQEQKGIFWYNHPQTAEKISIPYSGNTLTWPGLYSVLTPICFPISDNLKILHTTSNLYEIKVEEGQITLILGGDNELEGELVLEGRKVHAIVFVSPAGVSRELIGGLDRMVLRYNHLKNKELSIVISL